MLKDLLARFKKVLTVAEWKQEAQGAIKDKEFVIASLAELHRVEKSDASQAQERAMQRQPMQQGRAPMGGQPMMGNQPMMGGQPMQARQPMQQMGMGMGMQPSMNSAYATQPRQMERSERDRKKNELSLADLMNQIKQQQQIS